MSDVAKRSPELEVRERLGSVRRVTELSEANRSTKRATYEQIKRAITGAQQTFEPGNDTVSAATPR